MPQSLENFKKTLDEHHEWPCNYSFKFIVPAPKVAELKSMLDSIKHTERESKTGKFISITATIHAKSADEILTIYEKAATIEGIISL